MFQGPKLSCVFLEMRLSRWIKTEKYRIQSLHVLTPGFRRPSLVHGKVDWFFRTDAIINVQGLFDFKTINS